MASKKLVKSIINFDEIETEEEAKKEILALDRPLMNISKALIKDYWKRFDKQPPLTKLMEGAYEKRTISKLVPKRDENGEIIYRLNEDGSFQLDKKGQKIPVRERSKDKKDQKKSNSQSLNTYKMKIIFLEAIGLTELIPKEKSNKTINQRLKEDWT